MRTALLAVGLILIPLFSACAQERFRPTHVSPHAKKAVEAINQLRAIGVPDSGRDFPMPPGQVPGLLRKLNAELRALIIEDLNDQSLLHTVPEEEEILAQLRAAGWQEVPNNKWNAYGELAAVHFEWQTAYDPGLLLVTTQLWLPCRVAPKDPDSAVYIFQGSARQWQLVLETDADFTPRGADQESGLQYALSPPDERGKWYLLVAQMPLSCPGARLAAGTTRDTDVLLYKVLRPGPSPDKPVVLASERNQVSSYFRPAFAIHVDTDSFAVTQGRQRLLDNGYGAAILRYQLDGNKTWRISPLAVTPEDFFDQWIQTDWSDARRWVNDATASSLQTWHDRLREFPQDSAEFRSVQKCSGSEGADQTWLLHLWIDRKLNPMIHEENLFIEIEKKNGTYFVSGLHKSRPESCPGETPLVDVPGSSLPRW